MRQVEVGCIGVGWIGGLRAETLSRTALVDKLHLCDIRPDRLAEVKALYRPATTTLDYNDIINNPNISVVFVSTTPEANHYPIARDCLRGGKNVMLEKPIALELWEADELIQLAKRNGLKSTIGDSQRFNPKIAYAKKKITDGTLGKVVSVLVSRTCRAALGKKIAKTRSPLAGRDGVDLRSRFRVLAAGAGEAGACLFARRVRLHVAGERLALRHVHHRHDGQWRGGDDRRRLEFPRKLSELLLDLDRDHRHRRRAPPSTTRSATTGSTPRKTGQVFPMSTMPGEMVDHVFAGGMGPETLHFLEACIRDTPVMVTPESARTRDGDLLGRRPVGPPETSRSSCR